MHTIAAVLPSLSQRSSPTSPKVMVPMQTIGTSRSLLPSLCRGIAMAAGG